MKKMWQKIKQTVSPLCYVTVALSAGTVCAETVDVSGYVMLDRDGYDTVFLENGDEIDNQTYIRRARVSVKSTFGDNWKTKLQIDAKDDITLKDAYIRYGGWSIANITVGKQKEGFGLERLMSSRNLLLTERSLVSEALGPGRSWGVNLHGGQTSWDWRLGYFMDEDNNDISALSGRLTWAPLQSSDGLFHIGASASWRNLAGEEFRINEPLEVYNADSLFESKKILAEKSSLSGVEFIWQHKGLTGFGEWQQALVTTTDGDDYTYYGGYYQMSYVLSGKKREYDNGILGGVGSKRAWELSMRVSQMDFVEEDRRAQMLSVGVNCYLKKNIKLMADVIAAKHVTEGVESDIGQAVSLRAQFRF